MNYTYSKKVNINGQILWKHWIDFNNWHFWQPNLEYARIEGDFCVGNKILFKLKDEKNIILLDITQIVKEENILLFVDCVNFTLTKMYGTHKIIMHNKNESTIEVTIKSEGLLDFIWKYIVINDIIKGIPNQINSFIEYVSKIEQI